MIQPQRKEEDQYEPHSDLHGADAIVIAAIRRSKRRFYSPRVRRHHVQLHRRKPRGTKEAAKESTSPPSPTSRSDRMKNSSGNPSLLANLPKLAANLRRMPIHLIPSSHRRRRRESIGSTPVRGCPLFASRGDCSEGKCGNPA